MQLLTAILAALVVNTVAENCEPRHYGKFLGCVNGVINSDWVKIKSDRSKFIDAQQLLYQKCHTSAGCASKLDFDDFVNGLDDSLKKAAQKIRELWDTAPRGFQNCILTDARDRFLNSLQTCVNSSVTFKMPAEKDRPDVPLPPLDMYTDRSVRTDLVKFINDKLVAIIATNQCEAKRKTVIGCIKADITPQTSACVKDNLCGPTCKPTYKSNCALVAKCLPDILDGKGTPITALMEKDRAAGSRFLSKCEAEGKKEEPAYRYSRKLIVSLFDEISTIQKDEKASTHFGDLFKNTVEAYFDVNAMCNSGCD